MKAVSYEGHAREMVLGYCRADAGDRRRGGFSTRCSTASSIRGEHDEQDPAVSREADGVCERSSGHVP